MPLLGLTQHLAISQDGGRVATSSVSYDSGRGYVKVYERNDHDSWKLTGTTKFGSTHCGELGVSLSLNSQGSMLVGIARRGGTPSTGSPLMLAWIDDTPFCQLPISRIDPIYTKSVLNSFLDRRICRSGLNIVYEKTIADQPMSTGTATGSLAFGNLVN